MASNTVSDTGRLLRLYWLLDQRETLKLSWPARVIQILLLLMLGGFSALIGYGMGLFAKQTDLPVQIDRALVPGLILTFVLLAMVLVGTNQALRALFLSGDLDRLLATPVSPRAVMTAKLLSRLPSTILIMFVIAFPAMIAFGIGLGLGPLFYIAGLLLIGAAPLFGLAIGALLAMLLVRIIPTRRLNEYLGAASILVGIFFMVVFQLPNLMRGRITEAGGAQAAAALQGALDASAGLPLPTVDAGQGLVALGEGRILEGLGGIAVYLLMTAGLFAGVVLFTNKLYLRTWLRVQGAGERRHSVRGEAGGVFGGSSLDATMALKDWLLRVREPRHLMSMVTQIVALFIMGFVILRPGGGDESILTLLQQSDTMELPWFGRMLFSPGMFVSGGIVFMTWALFSNMALSALALEQRSFYVLKVAPISPIDIWRSKTLSVALPGALLGTLLFIGSWFIFRFSLFWAPYGWLCAMAIGALLLAFDVAIGMIYPRLEWEDPRRMTTQRAGWYNLIGSLIIAIPALILAAVPFALSAFAPQATIVFMLLGLLALGVLGFLFIRWVAGRVVRAWPALG